MEKSGTNDVVVVSAVRTAIGAFGGSLASLSATQLGSKAIAGALAKLSQEVKVDEVIMGMVLPAGAGQAPARQAALGAGLPHNVPCTTINKVCGSGLKAVMLGVDSIRLGHAEVVVAGGMESMSNVPYLLPKARSGYRLGHGEVLDGLVKDGLWDVYNDYHMGSAAELCASECNVSREDQDEYAIQSYRKALNAQEEGFFQEEIVPLTIKTRKMDIVVDKDEEPGNVNFDKLKTLRPAFEKTGSVTAGNASTLNDGAAALILMSREKAEAMMLPILATLTEQAGFAREPEWFTLAPMGAMENLLKKTGTTLDDIDLLEINEAFSVVNLAIGKQMKIPAEKVNVNGGAVALGHPIGASGARILVTLIHAMQRLEKQRGIAAICLGGGEAVAMMVER